MVYDQRWGFRILHTIVHTCAPPRATRMHHTRNISQCLRVRFCVLARSNIMARTQSHRFIHTPPVLSKRGHPVPPSRPPEFRQRMIIIIIGAPIIVGIRPHYCADLCISHGQPDQTVPMTVAATSRHTPRIDIYVNNVGLMMRSFAQQSINNIQHAERQHFHSIRAKMTFCDKYSGKHTYCV